MKIGVVAPAKPALGFELRVLAGYEVTLPLKELSGTENWLTVLFRVAPENQKDEPVYFSQRIHVPAIEDNSKGDAYLQGVFDLGEAPEDGRMIDPELNGGARQAAGVRNGLDEPEVIPGDILEGPVHSAAPQD